MAVYNVQAPDGKVLRIQGPEGASQEQILAKAKELYTPGKAKDVSTLRKLEYGFASARTDIGNLGDILESYIPLGTFFNPTETYGEEFMKMTPEQRRQFLTERRQAMIEKEYADVLAANEQDSLAANIGSFGGSIFSPTTLIPVGQGYKAIAVSSALLGAEYDVLDQYMKTGSEDKPLLGIDPTQTAAVSAGAAAFGTGAIFAGRSVKGVYNKLKAKKNTATKVDIDAANSRVDIINEATTRAVENGIPQDQLPQYIRSVTRLSGEEIAEAFMLSSKKPIVPTVNEVKFAKELGDNGLDTVNRINKGWFHDMWQPVADRIEQVAPQIALRLRKLDMNFHENTAKRMNRVTPFIKDFKDLSGQDQALVKKYLLNGDFDEAAKVFNKLPNGVKNFDEVKKVLKEMHTSLVEDAGYKNLVELPNYFPRSVVDKDGLFASLGTEKLNVYEKALQNRAKQLGISVEDISQVEKDKILNNIARGVTAPYGVSTGGLSAVQKRTIERLTDEQLAFYDDPMKGLTDYIRYGTNNIEKRKFFGTAAVDNGEILDVDKSIGRLSNELKEINPTDVDTLNELIKLRFTTGEKGAAKAIQGIRNFTYFTKLANPISAVTQAQDLGTSVWVNGLGNTVKSLFGKNARRLTMEELGLDQILAEEFTNEQVMAKTLHQFFTASGFRAMDKFGKNVLINSAFKKAEKLATTKEGIAKLRQQYGKAFGNEFMSLVGDLQSGKVTDNVKLYLWSELAKVQPTALSETPAWALSAPNGRVFYALKTFMLKQISNIMRRTKGEWDRGNKKQALKNAVSFALTVPTAGVATDAAKDMLLGRGFDLQDKEFSDRYFNNVLKLFGASEYMAEKASEFELGAALGGANFFLPAISTVENIGQAVLDTAAEGEIDQEMFKELPIAGKLYYMWLGGGIEKENDRKIKEFIKGEQ